MQILGLGGRSGIPVELAARIKLRPEPEKPQYSKMSEEDAQKIMQRLRGTKKKRSKVLRRIRNKIARHSRKMNRRRAG